MTVRATVTADSDGWRLRKAGERDLEILMTWFENRDDVVIWGGPKFRYPFTAQSFREDCHWPEMASYSLRNPARQFCAFGQFYNRNERINLARLVVHPQQRRRGIGRHLVASLMKVGRRSLPLNEFSLFVYRDNLPALECYRSLGFEITDYPPDEILAERCYYLTRLVADVDDAALTR